MSIRIGNITVLLIGTACLAFNVLATLTQNFLFVTLAALTFFSLILAVPITLVLGFFVWRKSSPLWILPSVICVVFAFSPWIARSLGASFSDSQFNSHLADFERAVEDIKSQDIPRSTEFVEIDLSKIKCPRNVLAVEATRCTDGAVVVEFLVSAGGRIHKGYLFKGCDDASNRPERHYQLKHIVGRWYHFSD